MPKSVLVINRFEGGLINYYDPRDIPENSLADANGIMVDIQGKLSQVQKIIPMIEGEKNGE